MFCVPPSPPLRSERDTTDRADKRHTHEQHKRERERVERGTWGREERKSDDRIEGNGDRMIANAHLADPRHFAAAAAIQSLCQIQQLRAQELCES